VPVDLERIGLDDLDLGESLPQVRDQLAIFFDGDDVPCALHQSSGESTRPWPNFQHGILVARFQRIGDSRQEPRIAQEMLPQASLCPGHR
jgi:hypothetical protein